LTDIHEIDSLKERIARIEKTVQELQESISAELEKAGEKPPEQSEDEQKPS
jgi:predicted  nucleic acid-binding Zn-ribbon protein